MKKMTLKIYVCFSLCSLILLNIYILNSTSDLTTKDYPKSNNEDLRVSNPTLWTWNYDDENSERGTYVYINSATEFQYLAVEFPIPSGRHCIVKGVRYSYGTFGTGPYNMEISYYSDDFDNASIQWWADTTDYNVPYSSSPSWRTVYHHGPVYAIDDDPSVLFSSDHPSTNCVALSSDTPNHGYSYAIFYNGVFQDSTYEYIVQLMYEEIIDLTLDAYTISDISGNDYLDAYFVYMEAGTTYNITVNRNSGAGRLNMRLVEFAPLTLNNIRTNTEINYPKNITFNPSTTGTYVVLIEPSQHNIDYAQYSIKFEEIKEDGPPNDNGASDGKNTLSPTEIRFIIVIILVISLILTVSVILIKRKLNVKNQVSEVKDTAITTTGVPSRDAEVIETAPALIVAPRKIFISYSTSDSEYFQIPKIAEKLKDFSELDEVVYWEADSSANIVDYMEETLGKSNIFLLFCSDNALNSKSVKDEWQVAFQLRKKDLMKIIPIYENEDHIPRMLLHLLNVKFDKGNFDIFINKLHQEILRD